MGSGSPVILSSGARKSEAIRTRSHSSPFALVHGRDPQLRPVGGDGAVDRPDHLRRPVAFDHLHRYGEVAATGIVLGVVHHFLPGGERDEFGVSGGPAVLHAFRRLGYGEHLLVVAYEMHSDVFVVGVEELLDGSAVGAAQNRVWLVERVERRVAVGVADDAQVGADDTEPGVRFVGDGRAEPPRLGEAQSVVGVHAGEEVAGSAPPEDGLGGVAYAISCASGWDSTTPAMHGSASWASSTSPLGAGR